MLRDCKGKQMVENRSHQEQDESLGWRCIGDTLCISFCSVSFAGKFQMFPWRQKKRIRVFWLETYRVLKKKKDVTNTQDCHCLGFFVLFCFLWNWGLNQNLMHARQMLNH
jgi:hypothetical protein